MNDKFTKPGGILDLIKGTNDHRILKNKLDILEKGGGEGSRGGKVVGRTSSGKPIYQSHQHNDIHGQKQAHADKHGNFDRHYADYKPSDHISAQHHHLEHSRKHHEAAEALAKEGKHDEASEHMKAGRYHQAQIDAHSHAKLVKMNASTRSSARHTVVDLKDAQHATKMDKKLPKGESRASLEEARKYIRNEGKHGTPEFEKSVDDTPDLEKGGEGSRGGKVIGHTSSGKAIYASSNKHAEDHKHFDAADHKSAHEFHYKLAGTHNDAGDKAMAAGSTDKAHDHWHTSDYHVEQMQQHEYAHHKKAGTRVPGHLAHWRHGEVHSEPNLANHAVKINQQHSKKSVDDTPDLVKEEIVAQDQTFGIQYRPSITAMYGKAK